MFILARDCWCQPRVVGIHDGVPCGHPECPISNKMLEEYKQGIRRLDRYKKDKS